MSDIAAIENDTELEKALEDLAALMDLGNELDPDQELLLCELGAAIEEYENIYYPLDRPALTNAAGLWNIGSPGGVDNPFYSVVKANGQIVAMQIPDQALAEQIASIPLLEAVLDDFIRVYHNCSAASRNPLDHDQLCPYRRIRLAEKHAS